MKNCNDILKQTSVGSVSESLSPKRLAQEHGSRVDNRNDWGSDDFRSIILRNMGEETKNDYFGTVSESEEEE